jgi:hypothetical protein
VANDFAVHLGGGAYLDSSGKIVFGPPTGAQIYQVPGGFRIDTKKIQEAFKDLSSILPQSDDDKQKWMKWGVPKNIVEFLGSIAGVAGIVATAISVYVWAIGILLTLMSIMTADDGMSPELAKTLFSIKNQLQGLEQIQRADKMIAIHADFDGRIDRMHGLLTRLAVENPTGAARASIFQEMLIIVQELAVPLSNLRNQEWATTYDADANKGRGFASQLLVFQHADGTLPPVPMQAPNVTAFDYRLGVPMLVYGATSFAGLLQVAMPWFRSAGMHAVTLRKTADAIDRFVLRMQEECLSRTEYTAQTVLQQQTWGIFDIADPTSGGPTSYYSDGPIAVGAFDLVVYNDAFLVNSFVSQFQAGVDTGPRGLFNYRWFPPPQAALDEIAAAANERSRQDYANMQVATGMFRLISTAAWLRFLTTPPLRSQTVSGFSNDTRTVVDATPTTAKSPKILFHGVIEEPATLKRYEARSRVRITTQLPGYTPQFHYRVVLRTVDCTYGNEAWRNTTYVDDIWQAEYVPAAGDPRCKRLRTSVQQGLILSEILLHEGASPAPGVNLPRRQARVQATTFDWYVPIFSPWSSYVDQAASLVKVLSASQGTNTGNASSEIASGGVSLHFLGTNALVSPTMTVMSGGPSPLTIVSGVDDALDFIDVVTANDVSLDKAERRHVKIEDVEFEWELGWSEGKLEVRVYGKPQSRPFQFYIVVEETVYSGELAPENIGDPLGDATFREHIHTPVVAEMVNQIVFVPERFFVRERKAIEEAKRMLDEFDRRFSESAHVGPGDPIEFLQRAIRESLVESPSTSTFVASMDKREAFAKEHAPRIWNDVVQGRNG